MLCCITDVLLQITNEGIAAVSRCHIAITVEQWRGFTLNVNPDSWGRKKEFYAALVHGAFNIEQVIVIPWVIRLFVEIIHEL